MEVKLGTKAVLEMIAIKKAGLSACLDLVKV